MWSKNWTQLESDSEGLVWGSRICISNQFPGDSDVAGLGTTFGRVVQLDFHVLTQRSGPDIFSSGKSKL